MIGPEQLSSIAETNFHQITREAQIWLREKAAEVAVIERKRFQTILIWAINAGIAGVLAAIAAWIAAWPVVKEWIR